MGAIVLGAVEVWEGGVVMGLGPGTVKVVREGVEGNVDEDWRQIVDSNSLVG